MKPCRTLICVFAALGVSLLAQAAALAQTRCLARLRAALAERKGSEDFIRFRGVPLRFAFEMEGADPRILYRLYFPPPVAVESMLALLTDAELRAACEGSLTSSGRRVYAGGIAAIRKELPHGLENLLDRKGQMKLLVAVGRHQDDPAYLPRFDEWLLRPGDAHERLSVRPAIEKRGKIWEIRSFVDRPLSPRDFYLEIERIHGETGLDIQQFHLIFPAARAQEGERFLAMAQEESIRVFLSKSLHGNVEGVGSQLLEHRFHTAIPVDANARSWVRYKTEGLVGPFHSIEFRGTSSIDLEAYARVVGRLRKGEPGSGIHPGHLRFLAELLLDAVHGTASGRPRYQTLAHEIEEELPLILGRFKLENKAQSENLLVPGLPWEALFPAESRVFAEAAERYRAALRRAVIPADIGRAFQAWLRETDLADLFADAADGELLELAQPPRVSIDDFLRF